MFLCISRAAFGEGLASEEKQIYFSGFKPFISIRAYLPTFRADPLNKTTPFQKLSEKLKLSSSQQSQMELVGDFYVFCHNYFFQSGFNTEILAWKIILKLSSRSTASGDKNQARFLTMFFFKEKKQFPELKKKKVIIASVTSGYCKKSLLT